MVNRNSRGLVLVLLTALVPLAVQAQPLPVQPTPAPLALQDAPQVGVVIGAPQAALPPAPGPVVGVAPPAPPGVPFPPAQGAPPGPGAVDGEFFVALQFDFVKPVVSDHLLASFTRNDGAPLAVQPASHALNWTLSPLLELGWRLPDGGGDVVFGYRFLTTDGTGTTTDSMGNSAAVKSRLDINLFDVNYISPMQEFAPRWNLRWNLGVNVVSAFYDTENSNPLLVDHASSNFVGAGPHAGIEIQRQFPVLPAFAFFGKADVGGIVGQVTQKYYETVDGDSNNPASGFMKLNRTQTVPTVTLSAGISYTPPAIPTLHFSVGYEFERWWSLGRAEEARLDLTTQSVFLRGQFDF